MLRICAELLAESQGRGVKIGVKALLRLCSQPKGHLVLQYKWHENRPALTGIIIRASNYFCNFSYTILLSIQNNHTFEKVELDRKPRENNFKLRNYIYQLDKI